MAGYIGTQAVSVNTTSATISDDLTVGDDLTVTDDATIGGHVGIGTATPTGAKTVITHTADAKALLIGKSSAMTAIYSSFLTGQSNTAVEISGTAAAGAGGPALVLSNNTVNASGCGLGGITFAGATSGSDKRGGIIGCATTANSSSNITADMFFFTNNAGTLAKKLNIGSAGDVTVTLGNLVIGTSGKGINFGAGAAGNSTSNLLDEYEEGTFTPVFAATGTAFGAIAYSSQIGEYTKIGGVVTIHLLLRTSSFTAGSTSGNVKITGLPFAAAGGTGLGAVGGINAQDSWANYIPTEGWVDGSSSIILTSSGTVDRTTYRQIPVANMATGSSKNRVYITATYKAD